MAYEKLGFVSGQVLKAEHLNHIEDGIASIGGSGDTSTFTIPIVKPDGMSRDDMINYAKELKLAWGYCGDNGIGLVQYKACVYEDWVETGDPCDPCMELEISYWLEASVPIEYGVRTVYRIQIEEEEYNEIHACWGTV